MTPLVEGGKSGKVRWLSWHRGNWCIGGLGQMGITGLAFLGEEKDAPEWIAYAVDNIRQGLDKGCRDGGWGAGSQYYCVGWCPASRFGKALKRVTGGKADLFSHRFLKNVHQFPLYFLMPDQAHYARIGNCNVGPWHSTYFFVLLADEYKNGHAQWLAHLGIPRLSRSFQTVFSFIFYDANVKPTPPSDLPTAKHFRDLDWACFRSGWDSPDDIWFTFKGGECVWDHIHGDGNSITLYAYGSSLLIDQGYPREEWGCRTEAHNTIRVNDQDQYPRTRPAGGARKPQHFCDLTEFVHTDAYDHIRGDATTMYDPKDVKQAVREVMYIRPDVFVVFDDVITTKPLPVDWQVHTFGDLKVDGSTITVTQEAAAVDIAIVEPTACRSPVFSKTFKEVGIRKPFDAAKADTFVKIRLDTSTERTNFLTVLMPRRAASKRAVRTSRIGKGKVFGVKIEKGEATAIALFAPETGEIECGDISAKARSCLVLREGDRVRFWAVHDGTRLQVGGKSLFQSDASVENKTGFGR